MRAQAVSPTLGAVYDVAHSGFSSSAWSQREMAKRGALSTEALQCLQPIGLALSLASAEANGELAMMKTLITTTVLALGLSVLSTPSFAGGYVVTGHAASPAMDHLQNLS